MACEWSEYVNKRFYGLDGNYKENTEEVEFKSGRTIKYLKNSVAKQSHAVSLKCKDTGTAAIGTTGMTEFRIFLDWYNNTAKSGTVPVSLEDLDGSGETKQYYVTVGGWSGQKYKEVSLTFEEA